MKLRRQFWLLASPKCRVLPSSLWSVICQSRRPTMRKAVSDPSDKPSSPCPRPGPVAHRCAGRLDPGIQRLSDAACRQRVLAPRGIADRYPVPTGDRVEARCDGGRSCGARASSRMNTGGKVMLEHQCSLNEHRLQAGLVSGKFRTSPNPKPPKCTFR